MCNITGTHASSVSLAIIIVTIYLASVIYQIISSIFSDPYQNLERELFYK